MIIILLIFVGNLQLYVVKANSTRPADNTMIWYKAGNQGNGWQTASADLGTLPTGYKVCSGQ